jgi:hypothetical protein
MKRIAFIFLSILVTTTTKAQSPVAVPTEVDHSYKQLRVNLNETGEKYVRFLIWHQVWATSNNFNANTSNTVDFSMRRSRFLSYAQISPKFLILTHFGLNNLNAGNMTSLGNNGDGPQIFLHDAWGEFKVNNMLFIGGGLHYWKGLTRLASQSTLNFMTLDQSRPFAHWFSLGVTDQFARHMGVYAKGDIGKVEYRAALNNPLNPNQALGAGRHFGDVNSDLTYDGLVKPDAKGIVHGNLLAEAYVKYDFLDKETMKLPFYVGTYLGKSTILSVGSGFFYHPKSMFNNTTLTHSDVIHWAGDVFFDHPVKGGAINLYASYQHFDYGKNYMSRWVGTGDNLFGHLGYYYQDWKIMPYVVYQWADYEGLSQNPTALNAGVNYFVNGHHAKLTLEYHAVSNNILEGPRDAIGNPLGVSQIRLQAHIFL